MISCSRVERVSWIPALVPLDSDRDSSPAASRSVTKVIKRFLRVFRLGRKDAPPPVPPKIRVVDYSAMPTRGLERKEGEHEMVVCDHVPRPGYAAHQEAKRLREEQETRQRYLAQLRKSKDDREIALLEDDLALWKAVIRAYEVGDEGVLSAYTRSIRRTDLLLSSKAQELEDHIENLKRRLPLVVEQIGYRKELRDSEVRRSQ